MKEYSVYVNGYWFDSLQDAEAYGDRPEPYRMHERTLWTLYQVLRAGGNTAVVVDTSGQEVTRLASGPAMQQWVAHKYSGFLAQLDQPVYTRVPHPQSTYPLTPQNPPRTPCPGPPPTRRE